MSNENRRYGYLKNWLPWVLAVMAVFLLGLNLVGKVLPLRDPSWGTADPVSRNGGWLSYEDALHLIRQPESVEAPEYATLINDTVYRSVIHYWVEGDQSLRVPAYKNYLLFAASYIAPEYYKRYEFCDPYRGLERGIGLCSQAAIIVVGLLEERRVPAKIVGLDGHVVAEVMVDQETEERWILDPDYGVILPYGLETVENNPEIIRPYYENKGYEAETVDTLVTVYGPEGNWSSERGISTYLACSPKHQFFGRLSYWLIWVLPALLLLPLGWQIWRRRKSR